MTSFYEVLTAGLSTVATGFAAFATWQAPRAAAKLAEKLRSNSEFAAERRRAKIDMFTTLMQERAAVYSEEGVKALNLVDAIFYDDRDVRDAWSELFATFNTNAIPPHVIEERLRKLLAAMAKNIGLGESMRTDDLDRVYRPTAIMQDRLIKDLQRQQSLASLQGQTSPASNSSTAQNALWPPKP